MRAGVVVTAEAAVADTVTTADTVEGTAVDTTPEGLLLLTIEVVVAAAAVAEGTTGRDRDPTHHVVIELKVQSPKSFHGRQDSYSYY